MLNREAIAYRVHDHLVKQGRKAMSGLSNTYRAPDGDRCAIGCLISDAYYNEELEDLAVTDTSVLVALAHSLNIPMNDITEEDAEFFNILQRIHDNCPPRYWPQLLMFIAGNTHMSPGDLGIVIGNSSAYRNMTSVV